jgi:phage-related protein
MGKQRKPLVWLHGEIKTPPFSSEARIEAGFLLGRLQEGESLGMPHSKPMPDIGSGCHELRVRDTTLNWRIFYALTDEYIVILGVYAKKTQKTPTKVIEVCRTRLGIFLNSLKKGAS